MEAQSSITKEQIHTQYECVWKDFLASVQRGETKTLSSYCKAMHIDYERLRRWIRTKGISVRACAQSICRDHPQPKSAAESGPVSFIQFAPSSMPVTSVSMRGISITFPDGVNLSLQEGNAESIADLLAIYRSRCKTAGGM